MGQLYCVYSNWEVAYDNEFEVNERSANPARTPWFYGIAQLARTFPVPGASESACRLTFNSNLVTIPDTAPESSSAFIARELNVSLTVNDLATSLAWYRDIVGFTVDKQHERGGKLIAVSLAAGDIRILINQDNGAQGADRVKGVGFSMQFTTAQNIDELASRITKNGGTLDAEPMDTPFGTRVFRLTDPNGFKLVISSVR